MKCKAQYQLQCNIQNRHCACRVANFLFSQISSFVRDSRTFPDYLSNLKHEQF